MNDSMVVSGSSAPNGGGDDGGFGAVASSGMREN
jgi:hypothetical protein